MAEKLRDILDRSFSRDYLNRLAKEDPTAAHWMGESIRGLKTIEEATSRCDVETMIDQMGKARENIEYTRIVVEGNFSRSDPNRRAVLDQADLLEELLNELPREFSKSGCECFKTGTNQGPSRRPIIDADARRAWPRQKTPRRRHMY